MAVMSPVDPPPARDQRAYTPADRAAALAVVAVAGSVRKAARQLGLPARTLSGWHRAAAGPTPDPGYVGPDLRPDLAAALDRTAWQVLGAMGDPAKLETANVAQLARAFATLIDKSIAIRATTPDPPAADELAGYDLTKLTVEQLETLDQIYTQAAV